MKKIESPAFQIDRNLIEDSVLNAHIQALLLERELIVKNDDLTLDHFRAITSATSLSLQERRIVEAFEPYGSLTTYYYVAQKAYTNSVGAKLAFSRAMRKLNLAEDFPLLVLPDRRRIRGIGCMTPLTDADIVIAHLLQTQGELTFHEISEILYPDAQQFYSYETRKAATLCVLGLEKRAKSNLELERRRIGRRTAIRLA